MLLFVPLLIKKKVEKGVYSKEVTFVSKGPHIQVDLQAASMEQFQTKLVTQHSIHDLNTASQNN